MARGYIYEISKNPENIGEMTEDCFYNMSLDYVTNIEEETAASLVDDFMLSLHEMFGFTIGREFINGKCQNFIIANSISKKAYFEKRFLDFKDKVTVMTLDEFLSETWNLEMLINDRYSDAVYEDECFHTKDQFIRNMELGVKYYISNHVVLMH